MGETLTTRHELPSGILTRSASFAPGSVDVEARTARVLWTTGAVRRTMTWEDGEVDEGLDLSGVDLSAWDGAPVRDAHDIGSALDTLGVVEPGTTLRTADGLESTVRFARTDEGDKALALVADGIARQWSVGYDQVAYVRTDARARTDVKGATVPLYLARSWRPRELSLVPVGADPGARTRAAAGAFVTVEEIIMSDTAAVAPPVDVDAVRAAAVAEFMARKAAIVQTAAVLGIQVDADAEAASTRSLDAFRAEAISLRAAEQAKLNVSGVHLEVGVEDVDKRRGAMVASILRRANPGIAKLAAAPGATEYNGSLASMLRNELHARGVSGALRMSDLQVAQTVMQARAGSGMSLSDLPNVFLDAMRKALDLGYEQTERTYTAWAERADFADYRDHHMIRLSDIVMSRTPKPEGGTFEQVQFSDARNKAAVKTYGLYWDLTNEMIVNDDLDAFSQAPLALADTFADLENYLVYSVLENNAALVDTYALFGAEHGNVLSTYGKPGATLAQALSKFRLTSVAGQSREWTYRHVIVPVEYRWEAEQYYLAAWAPATQAEARPASVGGKTVTASHHLTTGAWYVASQRSGIRYGYLAGAQGIQTAEEFLPGQRSYRMWAWSDFGAGARTHEGMVKILETAP